MDNYEITLSLSERQPDEVKLIVQATDTRAADELADVLASLMPTRTVYSSKQGEPVDAIWYGSAVKVDGNT